MTREEMNEEIQKKIDGEEKKELRKRRIKKFLKLTFLLTITITLFFLYTTYISTAKIKVREYRIINKKIPESFHGLKIIQFSDLHFGSTIFNEEVTKIVNLSNERKPDLVVFTGDLIDKNYSLSTKEQEKLIEKLKSMTATLGKYAILGDEDKDDILSTIFNQSDFTILRNEYDLIYKEENTPILLVGVSKEKEIEKAYSYFREETHNANIYTVTILHEPDTVDDVLSTYSSDLFLAGHSHNGNIRIPFIKYSPFKVKGAMKYNQDYYKVKNSELYISSGLGTNNSSGIRLFCRPSINFFRLSNK